MKIFAIFCLFTLAFNAQAAPAKKRRVSLTPADLATETFRNGRSDPGGCLEGEQGRRYCSDGVYAQDGHRIRRTR